MHEVEYTLADQFFQPVFAHGLTDGEAMLLLLFFLWPFLLSTFCLVAALLSVIGGRQTSIGWLKLAGGLAIVGLFWSLLTCGRMSRGW
jgi:lipopolysaccharide export LptBFGC system permease protein LptF